MVNYLNNQGNESLITNIKEEDINQGLRCVLNIELVIQHKENNYFLENMFVKVLGFFFLCLLEQWNREIVGISLCILI